MNNRISHYSAMAQQRKGLEETERPPVWNMTGETCGVYTKFMNIVEEAIKKPYPCNQETLKQLENLLNLVDWPAGKNNLKM